MRFGEKADTPTKKQCVVVSSIDICIRVRHFCQLQNFPSPEISIVDPTLENRSQNRKCVVNIYLVSPHRQFVLG